VTRVRRISALAACAVAFVGLSALPAQAKTAAPESWAAKYCGALTVWSDQVTGGVTEMKKSLQGADLTPVQGKSVVVGLVGIADNATKDFYASVKKIGIPDTDNGAMIHKTILKGIQGMATQIDSAKVIADNLPTTDLASFQASYQPFSAALDAVAAPFDSAMTKVAVLDKDDHLSDSLQKVQSCKALFG